VIESIKMVPGGVKIVEEQLNILAYADDIALIGKNEIDMRKRFVETENIARKFWSTDKPKKDKIHDSLQKNKIGHLKIKNYKFERVANVKYLGVILNEDNKNQIDLQERIKSAKKTYFMLQTFFKNKNISRKLKLRLKNTIIYKTLTYATETGILTKRKRMQLNVFERKVY
jgi:hypothetical protein